MDIEKIRELAQIAQEYQLEEINVTQQDESICIRRPAARQQVLDTIVPAAEVIPTTAGSFSTAQQSNIDFNYVEEIKSPMVGVFYEAPSPDAAPFVEVGSKVKKGDVLCIIEAMKLMNEITAKKDGEIVDICVHNGDVVEFGQTIFKIC